MGVWIRWALVIVAYLTLIHNALVIAAVIQEHIGQTQSPGGSLTIWVVELTTLGSPGGQFMLGLTVWTSILAVGCLYKVRVDHNETRCRKCGYILRGLTEPVCPECGQAI